MCFHNVPTNGKIQTNRRPSLRLHGADVFWLEQIATCPAVEMKDEDPDSLVLCGMYGTRFVEYTTVHRVDKSDCSPEVLAIHLKAAMRQLWARTLK
jgi:hypothetical protein